MLKFSVSRQTLPANYFKKTLQFEFPNLGYNPIIGKMTQGTLVKEPVTKNVLVQKGNTTDSVRCGQKPARNSPLKRTETIQMKVWSSQLNRIKRKTDSLRKKDEEIRERYQQLKKKAKRVFSSRSPFLIQDEEDGPTPTKKAKPSQQNASRIQSRPLSYITESSVTNGNSRRRPFGYEADQHFYAKQPRMSNESRDVDEMYSSHILDVPRKRYLMATRRHKSGSDIPSKSKENFDGRSPVPFPRTFLKNGKKCTLC